MDELEDLTFLEATVTPNPDGNWSLSENLNPDHEFPEYIRIISTLLCAIILLIGIAGNTLVLIVVWKNKDLRSSTNIFLVNLSVADLLILLVCMPPVLVELHSKPEVWLLGAIMCKLVPFAELSVAHASVLTILAISLERYVAICRPLRANYTCTKHRAIGLCFAIWMIGLIATSPMLAIVQLKRMEYVDGTKPETCLTPVHSFWPSFFFLSSTLVFFVIPMFVLIGLYWVISRHLMSDSSNASPCCPDHPTVRTRRQVVVMLAMVVLFFFVCLLPFRILTVYIILAPSSYIEGMGQELYYNLLYISRVMLYFNSAVNPILYNVMSTKFRDAFLKVLGYHVSASRHRWLCRHLSRQSTFTTSSTFPGSSLKSNPAQCRGKHYCACRNIRSVQFKNLKDMTKEINNGSHALAFRASSGPAMLSSIKEKAVSSPHSSSDLKGTTDNNADKNTLLRANSVV